MARRVAPSRLPRKAPRPPIYDTLRVHLEGAFDIASLLGRKIGGYVAIYVGGQEFFFPDALHISLAQREALALLAAGTLLVGGKKALQQFHFLYDRLKNSLP